MSIFAARESITTHSIHHRLLFKGFTVQKGDVVKRFLFFVCVKSTKNFLKKFSQKNFAVQKVSVSLQC